MSRTIVMWNLKVQVSPYRLTGILVDLNAYFFADYIPQAATTPADVCYKYFCSTFTISPFD